ncbi:MAG: DUF2254 domain-containing protein [Geminicoccaceae bacterium]|jgi:uncharacterized membrane protein|nr:DUF2254 domain-containing protein [Geminicoccaceae bacterium]MCB9966585.1 DUF2254 domain-containing protein [Geminicoccaceae bacterium]HRY22799.1 DUF2254 domain-containing protein [Geminicoccaceae bacterium]
MNFSRIRFHLNRLGERLWLMPSIYCIGAVSVTFLARFADGTGLGDWVPKIDPETLQILLQVIATTMLAVATFAVSSMVGAYNSASQAATPRAFRLVVADDRSKRALSTFIGAFIFGVVGLVAVRVGIYGQAGNFVLFLMTLGVFAGVVLTFVYWLDTIARLGRMGETIARVESAALRAFANRRRRPRLGGRPVEGGQDPGRPVAGDSIGYVQYIDIDRLQRAAEAADLRLTLAALPGKFVAPGQPLVHVARDWSMRGEVPDDEIDEDELRAAFLVGAERSFDQDPRFGLVVLSEIAGRALSPGINDPGTAIAIIGAQVRILATHAAEYAEPAADEVACDRVHVPELAWSDLLDDAFNAIARDGAGLVEVQIRLQKALSALGRPSCAALTRAVPHFATLALARAELALRLDDDQSRVREAAGRAAAGDTSKDSD